MKTGFRYEFVKGGKKYPCPKCGEKRFVLYQDTTKGELLPDIYGKCDRADNCGYHLNPYNDGYSQRIWELEHPNQGKKWENLNLQTADKQHFVKIWKAKNKLLKNLEAIARPVFIPKSVFETIKGNYHFNRFLNNLAQTVPYPFSKLEVNRVAELYQLGTITGAYLNGATAFPFIDYWDNIRAVQIKLFDIHNHTIKPNGTNWLHSVLTKQAEIQKMPVPEWLQNYNSQEQKQTCLFGEHLARQYNTNVINLVEAPKTAIYATLFFGFPNMTENPLWLATGSKGTLTLDRLSVLKGRKIVLYPDLSKTGNTFNEWNEKAKQIESQLPATRIAIFDFLELYATSEQRQIGADIADIIGAFDWKALRNNLEPEQIAEIPTVPVANFNRVPLFLGPIPEMEQPRTEKKQGMEWILEPRKCPF